MTTRQAPRRAVAASARRPERPVEEVEDWPAAGVAPWLPWVATLVSLAGVAVATYLTVAHFTTPALLSCPDTGIVNCAKVTTSPESVIVGIPVAVLGLAFFVAMVVLNLPRSWSASGPLGAWAARLRLAGVIVGICFVLYLVSAELLIIGSICIYCTAVHVLTFVLFVLVASGTSQRGLAELAPAG